MNIPFTNIRHKNKRSAQVIAHSLIEFAYDNNIGWSSINQHLKNEHGIPRPKHEYADSKEVKELLNAYEELNIIKWKMLVYDNEDKEWLHIDDDNSYKELFAIENDGWDLGDDNIRIEIRLTAKGIEEGIRVKELKSFKRRLPVIAIFISFMSVLATIAIPFMTKDDKSIQINLSADKELKLQLHNYLDSLLSDSTYRKSVLYIDTLPKNKS